LTGGVADIFEKGKTAAGFPPGKPPCFLYKL